MSDMEAWPPPDEPSAFESLCLDLWKEIWGPDSDAQKNGRSGQPQAGVDVFGRVGEKWVGVQCKQKSALLGARLTRKELEIEVERARTFVPSLSQFIIATTGPRDAIVQERAREMTSTGFRVTVWSWEEIWSEIRDRRELLRRIGPKYWPALWEALSLRDETLPITVTAGTGGVAVGGNVFGDVVVYNQPQASPPPVEAPKKTAPTRLTHVAEELIGRERERAALDAAWDDPKIRVVTLVAWGGVGKTSLVGRWAAEKDLGGADSFDWSFYSQGTKEDGSASGEPFLNAALRFFGEEEGEKVATSTASAWDKGATLAGFVARRRALLILDGLEPLQYPASSPVAGELKEPGVSALLRGLAQNNPGLCVVTTRERVKGIPNFRTSSAQEWLLEGLTAEAGVDLLKKLGVWGAESDLKQLVEDVKGHALTINLLGTFLRRAHKGDVRRRDRVDLKKADEKVQGGHAFKAIAAYETWLGGENEEGARQLAVLRLLGLFDRPATQDCLDALRREPAIPGLTDALVGLDEEDWNFAVEALTACGLLSPSPVSGEGRGEGGSLDAHPLLREYFARQLRDKNPQAWRAAHGRLFEHLRDTTPEFPETLEGLQPLYQAVAHGCHAGHQEESRRIYQDRIQRREERFSTKKLGAIGADLGAVACFFDPPWSRVSPALTEADQAWLLNEAAYRLRALGRLTEALEPMRAGMENYISQENWGHSAIIASNLSELELTLGEVAAAVGDAEQSVTFADRSGDEPQRMVNRTAHADAQHQAGRRPQALALFREAERQQEERQPEYPRLYSLQGFRYCDLLLAEAERAAGRGAGVGTAGAAVLSESREALREVEERATQTLEWVGQRLGVLDTALDHLTLGRAALYRSILLGTDLAAARAEIESAVDGLRRAGTTHMLPLGLLTRAWLHFAEGNLDAARADLDEAQEIAERGPMPLYLADVALYRGRFFGDRAALAEARRLIEKHGYGRRADELADAEAALQLAG